MIGCLFFLKIPSRNFCPATKLSKFNTNASHLTYSGKWDHRWGDWRLLLYVSQRLCTVRSVSGNTTKRSTAHRPEVVVCRHDQFAVLFFYYEWLAGGYFTIDNSDILYFWLVWYHANKWLVSFNHFQNKCLHKQDKIFTTVSSTTFVHMCCCNQHKIKLPKRGFVRQ